jgi:hypothetical protein
MITELSYLFQIEPPWITVGPGEPERVKWMPAHFYSQVGKKVSVTRLRGNKMRSKADLMNEFGAALQFFEGFGENWVALKECLIYLDEWTCADAYVLVVEQAEEVLALEQADQMEALLKTLQEVGEWWSKPITDNGRYNRKAIPFHTLLNYSEDKIGLADVIIQMAKEANIPVRT